MTERLIIRLASTASQKNHWLIWSDSENEIIASGQVDTAKQLDLLTEKAQQRKVICLLPSVDVYIKDIKINGTFNRQMQQALPYIVEEELATDVERLHFSVLAKQTDLVTVAICNKRKIEDWLSWLSAAQINCQQFIPEGLALPIGNDQTWQALQLDDQWLIREDPYHAWACDSSMLEILLESKCQAASQQITSYSPRPEITLAEWLEAPPMLPMELLVNGTLNNKINLLSGEFSPKKPPNKHLKKWRIAAIMAGFLFVLVATNRYLHYLHIEKQIQNVKQQVEVVYQKAFPLQNKLQYTRIKKKIKSMLNETQGGSDDSQFLLMLNELVPAFAANSELQTNSLKFDASKNELHLQISANNFQAFEKFSNSLPKHFDVQQGALNSSKDRVSGLLTIRKK
ncbi:type II secretion system protein GspL [Psychromonas sp. MME2]|uniref:type II secretion system protein GspL n=1 Tax=unclassified Psychromonas TaxID=2614957 RepID=UPI00339BC2E9